MNKKSNIFLVEDDLSFGAVLKSYLELNEFVVDWIDSGKRAFESFRNGQYDICILDVMLPHVDGFTIASDIRKINPHIPLLFLTAKNMKEDVLRGYQTGADDYITKPFDSEVLIYKLKAILNRNNQELSNEEKTPYKIGNCIFDVRLRILECNESKKKLSPKEAELLHLLYKFKNELLPREVALKKIWGDDGYFTTRSMDVYITKLRKIFINDPSVEIKNIHGSGFMLSIIENEYKT